MKSFRFYNLITGWSVFVIAAVVYLLTMEASSSFWDCGEFITTAYKLEVGHPPGAPFFMILGRFFTLFSFGNEEAVAITMNALSALASAFTILFLFWSITHLARKFYVSEDNTYKLPELITILGAGVIGSLAYTFSDSFWFSAVEAEVYATSSLFTAVVFWAMLKWENVADQPNANRWLVLIALLMGISIGVHLLNLLTIPALVFIYYFKKFKTTRKGIAYSILVSLLLLFIMQKMIIPGIPILASKFELVAVNNMGLPFFSGVAIYMLLLFGLIIFGIYYTYKHRKAIWNTVLLSLFVIVLGYSSYAVILIRSVANTPLDESNPETIFSLLDYLNREQYGDTPLLKGQYFNAVRRGNPEEEKSYYRGEDKYIETTKIKGYKYKEKFIGYFPRMWSPQPQHRREYYYWADLKDKDLYHEIRRKDQNGRDMTDQNGNYITVKEAYDKPTFSQNMKFFFRYQVGHMYFRYFMWNFAGRQNDIQGHGEATKGNWISGVKFLDAARLGPQKDLPEMITKNKGYNRYYFLPLILGLIGLIFHYRRKPEDAWVVTLLFVLTGLAIVVYLNQYPMQPRERDYAYAGSFYAFAIWIGLGVLGVVDLLSKRLKSKYVPVLAILLSVPVPVLMATENWDDHDRSGRSIAQAFARNYLNSLEENAILFTYGDNDTFPLWYVQEVEGFRTDVRVVNMSYLSADWYIHQMMHQFYDSDTLPLSMSRDLYRDGERDFAFLIDYDRYSNAIGVLSGRLKLAVQEAGKLMVPFNNVYRMPLDEAIHYLAEGKSGKFEVRQNSLVPSESQGYYLIPANKFYIEAKREDLTDKVLNSNISRFYSDKIPLTLENGGGISKHEIAQLDMIAHSNWVRPIYFANVSGDNDLGVDASLVQEGLAYRLAPIVVPDNVPKTSYGYVDTDIMYQKLMKEFEWGGMDDPDVYLDFESRRIVSQKYRYSFATLANALINEGKKGKALEVLDHCMEKMPHERLPYDYAMSSVVRAYFYADAVEKGMDIVDKIFSMNQENMDYYIELIDKDKDKRAKLKSEFRQSVSDLQMILIQMVYSQLNDRRDINSGFKASFSPYLPHFKELVSAFEKYELEYRREYNDDEFLSYPRFFAELIEMEEFYYYLDKDEINEALALAEVITQRINEQYNAYLKRMSEENRMINEYVQDIYQQKITLDRIFRALDGALLNQDGSGLQDQYQAFAERYMQIKMVHNELSSFIDNLFERQASE